MSDALLSGQFVKATRDERHPGVVLVTIDRPPVNALSIEVYEELANVFESFARNLDARSVVLTGAGNKAFVAGADVKQLSERTVKSSLARSAYTRRAFEAIRYCAIPVTAAVNGPALGAGWVIASVCDLIVASDKALFALPEIDVGALGASRHIARILPEKLMRELALSGKRVDGLFLKQFGAVNEVVPHPDLLIAAYRHADMHAAKSPVLMRLRKEGITLTENIPIDEAYRVEQLYTILAADISDAKEAAKSVATKSDPKWSK